MTSKKRLLRRFVSACGLALLFICCRIPIVSVASGDEPAPAAANAVDLPSSLDRFPKIYFFQSQAAEILPPTYRPIDIVEFDQRLQSDSGWAPSPLDAPQLLRGVYVAALENNNLVSRQSYWDISYRGRGSARLGLGNLGLALRSGSGAVNDQAIGRIVGNLEGEASVVVDGDSRISFGWTAAGKSIERGTLFDLQIPESIQTRLLIEVPRGTQIQAVDGVGRSLPSPPPEAGPPGPLSPPVGTETSWYSIEAGGLSRVRLRLTNAVQVDEQSVLSVRQASIQYELLPQSIGFTSRMLVDSVPGALLPMLAVDAGRVVSVRIGGSIVPWTEVTTPEGSGIRIDATRVESTSGSGTMNITIEGEAAWNSGGGSQSLPWPKWKDCRPILVATEMQAQIRLDASLNILRLQLPQRWRFAPTATAEDGSRLFRCVGSLVSEGPAVLVRPAEQQSSAESMLQLSATPTRFQAQLDSSIAVSNVGPQPVHLQIDPGWTINLVMLPASGRVIDLPNDLKKQATISIWPTLDELVDGRLQVQVTGSMPTRTDAGRVEFPATSFATIRDCRNRVAAVITPPVGFNWSGDVALRTTRITAKDLSAIQSKMIGEIGPDSLLVDLNEGRVSALTSRRPDIAFDAKSQLSLRLNDDRVSETYLVACESVSTEIQTIVVDLGAASGRPPMQWSALRVDGSSRRLLSTPLVSPTDSSVPNVQPDGEVAAANEVWQLELGDTGEREVMLVGRREYPFDKAKEILLPSVPNASNQTAQAVVMPSLSVTQLSSSVLRIPRFITPSSRISKYGAVAAECEPAPGSTVLRYDATEPSSITISRAEKIGELPVVWRETVQIEVSNRGGDVVTAMYDIDRGPQLTIDHDVNLRLVSVTDELGNALEYKSEPTKLRVNVSSLVSRVVVHWTRAVFSGAMARRWSAPRMSVEAIVLHRNWRLLSAPDTLIPSALLFGETRSVRMNDLDNRPESQAVAMTQAAESAISIELSGRRVWIVDSGMGYTVASMVGLCVFAMGWWLTARSPFIASLVWIFTNVPPVFLFVTSTLWYSSVCVPFAAGGLTAMTLLPSVKRWGDAVRASISAVPISTPKQGASLGQDRENEERNHGSSRGNAFSWTGRLSVLIFYTTLFGTLASETRLSRARAQSPSPPVAGKTIPSPSNADQRAAEKPFVMVPTDADGNLAGTKVYVPQSMYADIFRDQRPVMVPVRTKSASYRLRLEGTTDSIKTAELEARYQMEDTGQRTEMRLPFSASQILSVQWLTTSDTRPLRWSADGADAVRLTLPPASIASLLVRVMCVVEAPSRLSRSLRFPIPPVATSTLVVDAGFAVHRIELAKSIGEMDVQPELGRLTASIGAVDEIDLSITFREAARVAASVAQRRYWVHTGYDRTNIECEVDIADSAIRKGGEVSLVQLDGQTPLMMTNDWAIVANESISLTRRQLTLRSQVDNPGPIRLLWEFASVIASTSAVEDSVPMVIPEILSAGAATTPPAVIAIDTAQGLRLVPKTMPQPLLDPATAAVAATEKRPATTGATSAQTIDAFISSWKGFRGTASEVIVSESPLTRFVIAAPTSRAWQANEVHHLHVRPGELQLSYSAVITPGDRLIGPLRVVLPVGSELRVLTVNDVSIGALPLKVGRRSEISLPEPTGSDAIRVRVVLHKRVSQAAEFNPPRISIEPIQVVSGSYTLSRDQSLSVKEVVDGGLIESLTPAMETNEQLAGGWVPCWTWRLDQVQPFIANDLSSKPQLPGTYRVERRDISIESQQRTSLVWDQTRWSVETLLRLRGVENSSGVASREPIDFVSIELPTIWCDNLTVEPAEAWSRQPSIDPAKQIVRIRPEQVPGVDGYVTISLRGQRGIDSDSRLEVPAVRVLGGGKRDAFMTVPNRIEGRLLQWEAISAREVRLPVELIGLPSFDGTFPADDSPSLNEPKSADQVKAASPDLSDEKVYRGTGESAAVWLAPSRLEPVDAGVTAADFQLFAVPNERSKMLCRWDLNPGENEQITIDLPSNAKPREVWIDDEAVAWESSSQPPENSHESHESINVRLSLSRLAQSIVLVCELESGGFEVNAGIPSIRGISVNQTWMTHYEIADEQSLPKASVNLRDGWQLSTAEERWLGLATSIRTVTDSSLSRATDRSQDEVVQWITSWDQRFRRLIAEALQDQDPQQSETTANSEIVARLKEQELKWQQYLGRVAGEIAIDKSKRARSFMPPDHWRLVTVAKHDKNAASFPVIRIHSGARTLAVVIQTTLMLTIAIGLMLLLWRIRGLITPLVCHPASWLFATGLVSLAVAPIPVAVAVCGVALISPWLTPEQTSRLRRR